MLPFMKEAFKQSLDGSLTCETDDIVGSSEKSKQLRQSDLQNQIRLNLGLYVQGKLIGSFMGRHSGKGVFHMSTTVILPEHQGQGYYNQLLSYVVDWATENGFHSIESNHNVSNSKVISIKLKNGFYISGLKNTLHVGSMVTLTRFLRPEHEELFHFRNGFKAPSPWVKSLLTGLQ